MKLKMYLRMLLAAVAALFVATACDDSEETTDPSGGTDPTETSLTFEIAVSNIEGSKATLSVTPSAQLATYYWSAVKKSIYDGLGSDEAFLEDDQTFIQNDAKANQMTLTAYLQWVTGRGTATYTLTGLEATTEYYAYVYGITTDGTVTTGVTKVLFTSGEGGDEPGPTEGPEVEFALTPGDPDGANTNTTITMSVLALNSDVVSAKYAMADKATVDEVLASAGSYEALVKQYGSDMPAKWIEAINDKGLALFDDGCLPGTEYTAVVLLANEGGETVVHDSCSTTGEGGEGPELTMTLRAGDSSGANTHNSLFTMITAPNKDVTSFKIGCWTTATVEESGLTPLELVSSYGKNLAEAIDMINDQGCGISLGGASDPLDPNTSYTVIILGINAEGGMTVVSRTATTTDETGGGGETPEGPFEITISDVTSSGATASVIPEDKESYYWLSLLPAEYYEQYKSQLASYIEEEIAYVHEQVGAEYTIEQIVTILGYQGDQSGIDLSESYNMGAETTYYVFVAGVDPATGKVTTDVAVADPFTTLAAGDGPEFNLELVAGDSNGANTDTKAMLIVEAPNADIASGYRVLAAKSEVDGLLAQGATLEQLVTNSKYAFPATHLEYINGNGLVVTYSGLSPETSYTAIVLLANAAGGTTLKSAEVTTTAALGDPTEVEITTLTQGKMIHYGDAYGLPNNDYANWTIYLAASTVDLEAFSGTGDLLMLELNTAKSVTTEITPGTYTIGGRATADFKAFTCVPGYVVNNQYAYGTWFGSADKGYSNPMSSGTVEVSKTDNTYTFTFELLDASANKIFKGTFTGELTYQNSSQTSAPAKVLGKDAVRKMVAIDEVVPASLSAETLVMSRKIATANLLACGLKSRGAVAEFRCKLSEQPEIDSAFGLRNFSAVSLMGERKVTVKVRAARNE